MDDLPHLTRTTISGVQADRQMFMLYFVNFTHILMIAEEKSHLTIPAIFPFKNEIIMILILLAYIYYKCESL